VISWSSRKLPISWFEYGIDFNYHENYYCL